MKTDITGDKYGGRTVDFNGATNEDLVAVLNAFTEHINTLRGGDETQQAMYADLVKQISGKRMSAQEMSTLLGQLNGVKDNEAMLKRLAKARTGGQ